MGPGDIPRCCGKAMRVNAETASFFELICRACNDIVYAKKTDAAKPQIIDD